MDLAAALRVLESLGFTPGQSAVLLLLVVMLVQQSRAIHRLKVRSKRLAEDRFRLHTYEVETRLRVEQLEGHRHAGNDDSTEKPKPDRPAGPTRD